MTLLPSYLILLSTRLPPPVQHNMAGCGPPRGHTNRRTAISPAAGPSPAAATPAAGLPSTQLSSARATRSTEALPPLP